MTRLLACALLVAASGTAHADEFTYEPPGVLVPGSGSGRVDDHVYVPGMRFPIEEGPAYPNSQVWGVGGSRGPSGSQCDARNYSYPWHDNFCESRSWDMPLCPSGNGHQGQDMRPSTCADNTHWAVAAEDGVITSIGTYSVYLVADAGTRHRYLHMNRASIIVREGQRVSRGDRLGRISNEFGGTPTTIHLHYDLYQNVAGVGGVYVPTYMSLVRSYEELLGVEAEPCYVLPAEGGTIDDAGPCFRQYGPATYWRLVEGAGHGDSLRWTNAWDGTAPGNWASWNLHLASAGRYTVEVNVVEPYNRSTAVRYRVRHGSEETEVVLDQSRASGWVPLGAFDFAAGGDQAIEVFDNTGETGEELHITADAVRLTPWVAEVDAGVPVMPPDAGTEPAADPDGGATEPDVSARAEAEIEAGCACRAARSSDASSMWLVLAALAVVARRRR